MLNETTGGGVTEKNAEKSSAISEIVISGTNACSVAKTIKSHTFSSSSKQQQNFTSHAETHSSSSTTTSSLRKVHTLSFLHNEDLLATTPTTTVSLKDSPSFHELMQDVHHVHERAKMTQKALTLSRSISFNDQRRQFQRCSVQRTESTKEYDMKRKMTILSPIHGCFDSSELSMWVSYFYNMKIAALIIISILYDTCYMKIMNLNLKRKFLWNWTAETIIQLWIIPNDVINNHDHAY